MNEEEGHMGRWFAALVLAVLGGWGCTSHSTAAPVDTTSHYSELQACDDTVCPAICQRLAQCYPNTFTARFGGKSCPGVIHDGLAAEDAGATPEACTSTQLDQCASDIGTAPCVGTDSDAGLDEFLAPTAQPASCTKC